MAHGRPAASCPRLGGPLGARSGDGAPMDRFDRHPRHGWSEKTITFSGRFLISVDVIAWKSNPWRPLRRGVASVPTTIPRKDGSPPEGPKNRFQGRKPASASAGDDDGRRRINFPDGRFRRKSVCTCVCTFDFGGLERLQCLRAVRLRPVLDSSRMRFYAPYAVALKGKGPKRLQLPKEVHKVHTASLMFAHPYSSLASCSWAESA